MKNTCVLCICTIVSLISSAAYSADSTDPMSGEYNFSGQFTAGGSYSEYHSFSLKYDSVIQIMMNASCNVSNLYLGIDIEDSGYFTETMGQSDPENNIMYGNYPLAGYFLGGDTHYKYKVWLQGSSCQAGDNYNIIVKYTEYDPEFAWGDTFVKADKDTEPNNNKTTAYEFNMGNYTKGLSGHLGFFWDLKEPYSNSYRDGLDYFKTELARGSYTLHVMDVDQKLLQHDPYVPIVSIRDETGFITILSETVDKGATYEFYIPTLDTYYISVVSDKVVSEYTDMAYGGYVLAIEPHLCTVGLELGTVQVEDNVCGNTETISTTLKNPCTSDTFNDDLNVIFKVTGPSYLYEKTAPYGTVNILPGKSVTVSHDWFIPEKEYTGTYTSCIGIQKSANGEIIGEACGKSNVLCKNLSRAHLMLLLRARKSTEF